MHKVTRAGLRVFFASAARTPEKRKHYGIKGGVCALLACIQLFMLTITAYARPDWPADAGIMAEAGIVMDMDSGTVILAQNSHVEYPPASITKILTALLVIENAGLDEVVTYSATAMNSVERDSGNKLSLVAGDTMTVEDCLYALLLQSVNQAANALAEHVAGSIPAFVEMMNDRVAQMGLTESHFENPSGLNGDSHYVSAYDMAQIARAAYSNPTLLSISEETSHKLGATSNNPNGITVNNEHRLVITEDPESAYYCPEAKAGKTGYLLAAGNTLVTYAEKDGRRLVSVVLKGSPKQYFIDGKTLLDFGFANFQNVGIAENESRYVTGEDTVSVNGADYSPSELMVEPDRVITLPDTAVFSDAELEIEEVPEDYPVGAVGLLQYTYNDRKIGSAFLVKKAEYTGEMVYGSGLAPAERWTWATEEESGAEKGEETEDSSGEDEESGTDAGAGTGAETGKEAGTGTGAGTDIEVGTGENPSDGTGDAGSRGTADGSGRQSGQSGNGTGSGTGSGSGDSAGSFSFLRAVKPTQVLAAAVILAAAGGIGAILYRRKKEAEAAASRRERRRQRLKEAGPGAEAAFEQLMEKRRGKGKGNESQAQQRAQAADSESKMQQRGKAAGSEGKAQQRAQAADSEGKAQQSVQAPDSENKAQ